MSVRDVFRKARHLVSPLARRVAPVRWKRLNEALFWAERRAREGVLRNDHYMRFYTTHFGLSDEDYRGRVVADIGCGPRGSLVWATMAGRRIGIDPLMRTYLKLGARLHDMEYIAAPSEAIPLPDQSCDVVCSFNALDHVENVSKAVSEIGRITRIGGTFLLIVEVNHPPTDHEPHCLTPMQLLALTSSAFTCVRVNLFAPIVRGAYDSIDMGQTIPDPETSTAPGFMSARFVRRH